MSSSSTETGAAPVRSAAERPQFFYRSAIVMAVIVVLSFPLTYYMPALTGSRNFHLLHHLHALAYFAWIALYVWQTRLAATCRIARHREIGLAGFALTGALVPLGFWMAQRAAEIRVAKDVPHPYEFTWFNLTDIGLFAGLMIASILLVTRHREWHRRLTFTAALCLVAPAATRWTMKMPWLDPLSLDIAVYLVMDPFLIALLLFDRRTFGKFHPATLTCVGILIPVQIASAFIARSDWWNALAPSLIGPP